MQEKDRKGPFDDPGEGSEGNIRVYDRPEPKSSRTAVSVAVTVALLLITIAIIYFVAFAN